EAGIRDPLVTGVQTCALPIYVGVCLQAYLHRTTKDLEALLPIAPAIRLVKGAYNEPADVAFPKKRDVDENYRQLAKRLLTEAGRSEERRVGKECSARRAQAVE